MRYEITKPANRSSLLSSFFGDGLLEDFFSPVLRIASQGDSASWSPAVDIVEKEDRYIIKADLPGVNEKDISVELKDNVLTIKGERKSEFEEEKDNLKRCERTYGMFSRSFTVYDVAAEKIDASYDNGTLKLELPKAEETKAQKIEIKKH
jgi:HSP20 family protein